MLKSSDTSRAVPADSSACALPGRGLRAEARTGRERRVGEHRPRGRKLAAQRRPPFERAGRKRTEARRVEVRRR